MNQAARSTVTCALKCGLPCPEPRAGLVPSTRLGSAARLALAAVATACGLLGSAQASGGGTGANVPAPAAAVQRSTADAVNTSRQAVNRALVLQCTRTADCATIGIGARACGGPEQFLAYSVQGTPPAALQQATERYAALRKKQLEELGEMSTCEVLPDPGALCSSAGQCQLQVPPGGRRGGQPGSTAR